MTVLGCGDTAGSGGSGGSGDGANGLGAAGAGGADATGGSADGGSADGGSAEGGAGDGGQPAGGGGQGGDAGADHCANAVRCDGVDGYYCHEVSGPDAAFEEACANVLFGNYADGPCGPEANYGACLFDCIEPSIYAYPGPGINQAQCERGGGTFVENP